MWDSKLKKSRWYAAGTIILERTSEVKVNIDPKMVLDTLSSQDASTYQIFDSYLK